MLKANIFLNFITQIWILYIALYIERFKENKKLLESMGFPIFEALSKLDYESRRPGSLIDNTSPLSRTYIKASENNSNRVWNFRLNRRICEDDFLDHFVRSASFNTLLFNFEHSRCSSFPMKKLLKLQLISLFILFKIQ